MRLISIDLLVAIPQGYWTLTVCGIVLTLCSAASLGSLAAAQPVAGRGTHVSITSSKEAL